jgi:hypothetical protein
VFVFFGLVFLRYLVGEGGVDGISGGKFSRFHIGFEFELSAFD